MKIFNHSDLEVGTPQQLASTLGYKLYQVTDKGIHWNCRPKAAYLFGKTYGPLSSWGRIFKVYLELLEQHRPGIISALIANNMLSIFRPSDNAKINLVVGEFDRETLRQPSPIGSTGFYYETFTDSKTCYSIFMTILSKTETINQILVYKRS